MVFFYSWWLLLASVISLGVTKWWISIFVILSTFVKWNSSVTWRREWQPTPVFLLGEFHGQRSLAGYSPWGHKESNTTKWLTHAHRGTSINWGPRPLLQVKIRLKENYSCQEDNSNFNLRTYQRDIIITRHELEKQSLRPHTRTTEAEAAF